MGKDLFCSSDIIVRLIGNLFSYKENELNNDINFVDVLLVHFYDKGWYNAKDRLLDESVFLYCEEDMLAYKLKDIYHRNVLLGNETFIHEHSVSINKNISSKIDKYKILYRSKIIYHKNIIRLIIYNCLYQALYLRLQL